MKTQQSAKRESGNLVHRYLVIVITNVPFTCEKVPFAFLLKVVPIGMAPGEANIAEGARGLLVQCCRQGCCCVHPVAVPCVGFARSGPGFGPPGFFSRSEPEPEIFRALGFSGFSGFTGFSGFSGQKNGVDVSYQFCHL